MTLHTQRGNAITLTLLGLALAILAGVVVLYFVGKQRPVPVPVTQTPATDSATSSAEDLDPRAGWNEYQNEDFAFHFEYPNGWAVATGTILGAPVITVYDAAQSVDASSTFGVHELATRISFYPEGLPMGGIGDQETPSNVIITVPQATARNFILQPSKRPWATVVRFDRRPESWTDAGFIMARVQVEDEEVAYMRGEEVLAAEDYDPLTGDHLVRSGFVDLAVRATQEEILHSFAFVLPEGEAGVSADLQDLVQVTSPEPQSVVASPLMVTGVARGNWYFEGSFPVELRTSAGEVLASVPAVAEGEWMTEEFVPFSVSISFDAGTATSGVLRVLRDNPGEVPTLQQQLDIPVLF